MVQKYSQLKIGTILQKAENFLPLLGDIGVEIQIFSDFHVLTIEKKSLLCPMPCQTCECKFNGINYLFSCTHQFRSGKMI